MDLEITTKELDDLARDFTLEELRSSRSSGDPDWTIHEFYDRYMSNKEELILYAQK
jgi:hypothetical protein